MKFKVIGVTTVHDHHPGEVVEPEPHWDVEFLVATGHLEPAESPAKKTKNETSESEENQ
jgi:hypothetical protein